MDDVRKEDQEDASSDSSSICSEVNLQKGDVVGRKWRVGKRVGKGAFGICYTAEDTRGRRSVCLKVERPDDRSRLEGEYDILRALQRDVPETEMLTPRALDFVKEGRRTWCLVQELLGPSLESLYQKLGQQLSEHTVLMLAPQVIDCISHVHRCGYVHRDIKPHNFLVGRGDRAGSVYIIDFGLAKKWRREDGSHQAFKLDRDLTGTVRYVSNNVHRGYEQSRRDDLLSIGYMLVYLARGKLPWQGLKMSSDRRSAKIHELKERISLPELCKGLSPAFVEYFRYCRGLDFEEEPDYCRIRRLFRDALKQLGLRDDPSRFDWVKSGDCVAARRMRGAVEEVHRAPTMRRSSSSRSRSADVHRNRKRRLGSGGRKSRSRSRSACRRRW